MELTLEDGTRYGSTGRLQFTEGIVDPATGTVTLRATFPNPQGLLLPGMFVRAGSCNPLKPNAILVPQQAVSRGPKGDATVLVVGCGATRRSFARSRPARTQGAELGGDGRAEAWRQGHHAGHRQGATGPVRCVRCRRQAPQRVQEARRPGQSPKAAEPGMISRVFIERPILAWVVAIIIMLLGVGAIRTLPTAQYPDVAPTQVNIRATYPGASAETLQASVTQVLEQQLTGIDGLLYFQSSSDSRGSVAITGTFDTSIDADIAQVQVQNKVQQAIPRLPTQVQAQGISVTKSNADFLIIVGRVGHLRPAGRTATVSDYMVSNMQDTIARIPGVGNTNVFGSQYAMRIWMDPAKLANVGLMPSDVTAAIRAQNTEVAAGEIGGLPAPPGQMLNATVTSQSRLQTPDQFRAIVVKSATTGATVRLADVARVELGQESYAVLSRINGHPGAGIAVLLAPGADALTVAQSVKTKVESLSKSFPPGFTYAYPLDSTAFIKLSVDEVVKTLIEAIVLVVVVMFVFLQNWRATLVPTIAVPVVLLGTSRSWSCSAIHQHADAVRPGAGDRPVGRRRHRGGGECRAAADENPGMTPKEATLQSMAEIQTALIAIALVLSAGVPADGILRRVHGVIYRQFSITIVSAMMLSVVVALVLSPALTASLLKARPEKEEGHEPSEPRFGTLGRWTIRARDGFNDGFDRMVAGLSRRSGQDHRSQMAVPARLPRHLRGAGAALPAPAVLVPADGGSGGARWCSSACLPAPPSRARSRCKRRWRATSWGRRGHECRHPVHRQRHGAAAGRPAARTAAWASWR